MQHFVRIWNAHSGQLVRKVEVQDVRVAMIARDGRQFFTLDANGIAKRWDTASGVAGGDMRVGVVGRQWDSDTDSGYLFAAQRDGNIAIWDWEREEPPVVADLGWRPASGREMSRDGTRYVGCANLTTLVWDRAGRVVSTLHQSRPAVGCSIDDDAKHVITTDIIGKSTIWNLASGEVVSEISGGDGGLSATFVGPWLVTYGGSNVIELRDPMTGTLLASYAKTGNRPAIGGGTQHRLALPNDDGSIDLVRLDGGRLKGRFVRADHPWETISGAVGDRLLTQRDHTATLWDLRTSQAIITTEWPATLNWIGTRVAAAHNGSVVVLDAKTGGQLGSVPVGPPLISVDVDSAGKRVIACQRSQPCGVWDVQTGVRIASTPAIKESSWAALTPDGGLVVEIEAWVPMKIHSLDGGPSRTLGEKVFYVAFSDDGSRVAWVDAAPNPSMSVGWMLVVADLATGKRLIEVPNGAVTMSFDHTGDLLASFGESGIQLWRVSTGTLLRTIETRSPAEGMGIALSPDGSLMQTGTGIWSAADGRRLATFLTPGERPIVAKVGNGGSASVSAPGRTFMSSDGKLGATYSSSTDVTLWDLGAETRSPAEIKRVVDQRVPWRVVDGRLVPQPTTGRAGAVRREAGRLD